MREIDDKDLVPVTWDNLFEHLNDKGSAVVYLKTGDKFERCHLQLGTDWYPERTKQYIKEGRLFRRRNKYFLGFDS